MTKPRSIPIADLGTLKNELAKYKKGKKLDIRVDENLNGMSFAA